MAINHVTISNVGEVSVILNGNYFSAFEEDIDNLFSDRNSSIYKFFRLNLLYPDKKVSMNWEPTGYTASKTVEVKGIDMLEASLNELIGSDLAKFMDSLRYEDKRIFTQFEKFHF